MSEPDFKSMIPPECYELLCHVWDLLDGRLTPAKRRELEGHLTHCKQCYKYAAFQDAFLNAMAKIRSRRAPERLKRRVERTLAEAGFSATF